MSIETAILLFVALALILWSIDRVNKIKLTQTKLIGAELDNKLKILKNRIVQQNLDKKLVTIKKENENIIWSLQPTANIKKKGSTITVLNKEGVKTL